MSFTSSIFLIGLLPWFFMLLYLTCESGISSKKFLILMADCLFYIFGGVGQFLFLCCFSLALWIIIKFIIKFKSKVLFVLSVALALIPLLAVKYLTFALTILNGVLGLQLFALQINLITPIGISFFTFEAISLLCDIHSGKVSGKLSILNIFLYLSFFATVTSGPIVRYQDFRTGLGNKIDFGNYANAIERIIIGLCKKVIIADKIAPLADYYFNGVANGNAYSAIGLWIGSAAYTLQLYFDFSGYSDMAIGLAGMLGFQIPENFNRPYQAKSISDFWRRWHISLSQWFRDYVYIPLGGNRCSVSRHIINLLIVWALTGLWHGVDWSFIIWGLGFFVLLTIEKYIPVFKNIGKHWYGHIYTLFFVNLLWIPFRADSLASAYKYILGMFNFSSVLNIERKALSYLPFLAISILLCLPLDKVLSRYADSKAFKFTHAVLVMGLSVWAICAVINAAYTPYIYGNF